MEDYLRVGGYVVDGPALAPDEILTRVVAAVRPAIAAGDVTLAELKALVDAWTTATAPPRQA